MRILNKVDDPIHNLGQIRLHLFVTALARGRNSHKSSVSVLPVWGLQHSRGDRHYVRENWLATESAGKTVKGAFCHNSIRITVFLLTMNIFNIDKLNSVIYSKKDKLAIFLVNVMFKYSLRFIFDAKLPPVFEALCILMCSQLFN